MREFLMRAFATAQLPVTHHGSRITLALLFSFVCLTGHSAVLTNGFAHNDYVHSRPLLDALDAGFCGIEADIHLVDGKLLVGHDSESLRPERTLAALYLDPLHKRVRANRGKVYPSGPEVLLLIDIKTEAGPTYRTLRSLLPNYKDMLTAFTSNSIRTNAVTIILSGNRPMEIVSNETTRLVAIDGRVPDLEGNPSLSLIPLISDNWTKLFQWRGEGSMPEPEKLRLQELVQKAHQQRRKLRLWAAPDTISSWRVQQEAGFDWINTDNLSEFGRWAGAWP
jgi:hypothetical protein